MRRTTATALIASLVVFNAIALTSWLPLSDDRAAHAGEGCTDPTPGAGGQLEFTFYGFLSENHFASAEGDVCPDETEVWTFTSLLPPVELGQHIGTRVLVESGSVLIRLRLPSSEEVFLQAEEEYHAIHRDEEDLVTYMVEVTGAGTDLANYRVEACRGGTFLTISCIFEKRGQFSTAEPSPSATLSPTSELSRPTVIPSLPPTGSGGGGSEQRLLMALISAAGAAMLVTLAGAALQLRRDG